MEGIQEQLEEEEAQMQVDSLELGEAEFESDKIMAMLEGR